MNAIFNRTSVRQFTDQPISSEDVSKILNAAFHAPSAVNLQPWEFIVVEERSQLGQLAACSPYAGALKTAAMAVVVLTNTSRHLTMEHDIMDCSAATENMLVEARELNIGSCWLGIYPDQDRVKAVSDIFALPEGIIPLWIAAFGYARKEPAVKDKWDESKLHWGKY